jgi:hypothetical protein
METEPLLPTQESLVLGEETQLYPTTLDICPYVAMTARGKVRIAPSATIWTNVITSIGLLDSTAELALNQIHYALEPNRKYVNTPVDRSTGYSHFNLEAEDLADAKYLTDYPNPHLESIKYVGGTYAIAEPFTALETFRSFADTENSIKIGNVLNTENEGAYFRRFISLISIYQPEDAEIRNYRFAMCQQFMIPDLHYLFGLQLNFSLHDADLEDKGATLEAILQNNRGVRLLSDICAASLGVANNSFEPMPTPRLDLKFKHKAGSV